MASNIEQSAGDLFGAGEIPAQSRFFSLAPGGMGVGMTIGDRYNHLLKLQKERADVLANMASSQRSELDLMNTTQEIVNLNNRHSVLDELDQLSFRDEDLSEKLSLFDRAQLMDPVVAKKVSSLSNKASSYQQGKTQIVQSLYDAGVPRGEFFDGQYSKAKEMLDTYNTTGLAKFFATSNMMKASKARQQALDDFSKKEEIKAKFSKIGSLQTLQDAHLKELRTITEDTIPSSVMEANVEQFYFGLPFEGDVNDEEREIKLDAMGNPVESQNTPTDVKIKPEDKLFKDFIQNTFTSFTAELVESGAASKEAEEAGRLGGLIMELQNADKHVDTLATKARELPLKAFLAWGTEDDKGLKGILRSIKGQLETGAGIETLMLFNDLTKLEKEVVDVDEAYLTSIWNFNNALNKVRQLREANLSGERGKLLEENLRASIREGLQLMPTQDGRQSTGAGIDKVTNSVKKTQVLENILPSKKK